MSGKTRSWKKRTATSSSSTYVRIRPTRRKPLLTRPHPSQFSNLRHTLNECARALGVKIQYDVRVMGFKADRTRPSITLDSGEVIEADVVIMCDGHYGPQVLARKSVLDATGQKEEQSFTGMQVHKYVSTFRLIR